MWQSRYLALLLLALVVLAAPPALAADSAKRHIFGFSPDGKYFAFEQYGVQDGSGFPYVDIFVIDVEKDVWVKGTPVRDLVRRGGYDLEKVRESVRLRADPFLWRLNIGTKGKHVLADPAEKAEDAARFLALTIPDEEDYFGLGKVRLRLTEVALPLEGCATIDEKTRGFVLVLEDEKGQPIRILEEDAEIPKSRGCPIHYGLSDVLVLPRRGLGPALIVVVSIYRYGFEGFDRRFIAIGTAFDVNPTTGPQSAPVEATPSEAETTNDEPEKPLLTTPSVLLDRNSSDR